MYSVSLGNNNFDEPYLSNYCVLMTSSIGARPDATRVVAHFRQWGSATALYCSGQKLTYEALADRIDRRSRQLAPRIAGQRLLVSIAARNTEHFVIDYLATLAAGHTVLLVGPDAETSAPILAAWKPDIELPDIELPDMVLPDRPKGREEKVRAAAPVDTGAGSTYVEIPDAPRYQIHPDLSLLLSTSGSTGSPKLVRLSHHNLLANARSITEYLGINQDDRAITTLPPHYCYGLSVLHSHLLAGATVVLNEHSVSEAAFWDEAAAAEVTSFAGVPYTYELINQSEAADLSRVPSLRYLTQAGGKLPAETVKTLATKLRAAGIDFVVMYGQTEATARMSYLPPELAESASHTIGRAIPGGTFRIQSVPDAADYGDEVGELIYSGDNVMLGYAEHPDDLARGGDITELATGDLARFTSDDLVEIVGRRGKIAKIHGHRLDLARIERQLGFDGYPVWCVGFDRELVVVGHRRDIADPKELRQRAGKLCGLGAAVVRVECLDEVPRTSSGKVATAQLIKIVGQRESGPSSSASETVAEIYKRAIVLESVDDNDTFVDLGGDSLTYVAVSLALDRAIGRLPINWHVRTVGELETLRGQHIAANFRRIKPDGLWSSMKALWRSQASQVETTVALRALFIVLIVAAHAHAFDVIGGAHVLMAIAGATMARFRLAAPRSSTALGISALRIVAPAVVWLAIMAPLGSRYSWYNVVLLNNVFGPRSWWADRWWNPWQMWFVEAVVYSLLIVAALVAIPPFAKLLRAHPFAVPLTLCLLALSVPLGIIDLGGGPQVWLSAPAVFWLFTFGWAATAASWWGQRLLLSVIAVVTTAGWFGDPDREVVIVLGLLAMLWIPTIPIPTVLVRVCGVLAGASLFIYITHFMIYPPIRDAGFVWTSVVVSLLAGIVFSWMWGAATHYLKPRMRHFWTARQHLVSSPPKSGVEL